MDYKPLPMLPNAILKMSPKTLDPALVTKKHSMAISSKQPFMNSKQ